jgi:probable rRNA maturation factor
MADFEVTDRSSVPCDHALIERAVQATLRHCGVEDLHVSLLLTGDEEIAQIHADYLDDPTPTDVISFALEDGAELVVSVETAARVAGETGHDVLAEVVLYVVHGLLHCCGFDDIAAADRVAMRAAEREILTGLGLSVAAVDSGD